MLRVGHKGADGIVPGNTPASFDAALAHGVDMIELDVLAERNGGDARWMRPSSNENGVLRAASP